MGFFKSTSLVKVCVNPRLSKTDTFSVYSFRSCLSLFSCNRFKSSQNSEPGKNVLMVVWVSGSRQLVLLLQVPRMGPSLTRSLMLCIHFLF